MANPGPIPLTWVKQYVDQLMATAEKFGEGAMRDACLLRANHALDLVEAWKEASKGGQAKT